MKNDFSKGKISKHVLSIAGPMILAQLIHVLYNIVGEYDAKLTVIDKFNNKTEKEFKIKIKDSTKYYLIILEHVCSIGLRHNQFLYDNLLLK